MEKPKSNKGKSNSTKLTAAAKSAPVPASPPAKVPPLFRPIDWVALIVCFAVIWTAYLLTLAPDLTLEDSGELCTASFYAGIPHPPGYPFWAIYSFLWTKIVPFGSVTWRVEVGESFAAAMACGLVGFMVSRGSSMLIEGIADLKEMKRKWEGVICVVCGITAGLLLGFDNFMWKESIVINRIAVFDVPWLMVVALCILRWIYAPHQQRYLYIAMFFFGVCATIHQTMLCAAMGIEVAIAFANPKLGRSFFLGNSIIYLGILILMSAQVIPAFEGLAATLAFLLHAVGIASVVAYIWLAIITKESFNEFSRDGALAASFLFLTAVSAEPGQATAFMFLSVLAFAGFVYMAANTWRVDRGWLIVLVCGLLWVLGVSFYFYEPIAGMTDPPMQWGYPRTVEGFFHALSRGQYEKANPTDIFGDPWRFLMQLGLVINGLANSFSWVCLFVALVPFLFLFKMQKRERAWLVGLMAIYFCVGILLCILMNTTPDRQTADENKVFFTASHAVMAILIGYGLALISAYMATHYKDFRTVGLMVGAVTLLPALVVLYDGVGKTFYGGAGTLDYRQTLLLFICMTAAFVLTALAAQWFLKIRRTGTGSSENGRVLLWVFACTALVFLVTAASLAFFGEDQLTVKQVIGAVNRIFEPNQYSMPVIAGLLIVFTVVAFIGGLLVYRRRAPVLISLGLFLVVPISSGISHWAKCEQRNHWFGYWFGHDMFTPPFAGPDGQFSYDSKVREQMMKGPDGDLVYPEMARHTILFGGTDPGRFCPTYMIFCESFVPPKDKPMDPDFDRRDVYLITQNALADGTYLDYLRAQYFRSAQHDPPFFSRLFKYIVAVAGLASPGSVVTDLNNPDVGQGNTGNALLEWTANLLNDVLDKPLTARGAKIEARWRKEGVYPSAEIYIPSPEDSARCFRDYTQDAYRREKEGRLQQGEDVHADPASGQISVSGQVAVMMINGLLCRVIFDRNPTNEFYVEESFPLEWMYPYETPFGIIMKINRDPIVRLPDDVFKRDHAFWTDYSKRLIGNWITYDTSVQQIADWVQKVYLHSDYSDFKGDRKFIRDDGAQKAFSKLRSSQAGLYAWRLRLLFPNPPPDPKYLPYRPKSDQEVEQLEREADFAFKQAFAFCPYSPEAVIRYANFLLQFQRWDDALIIAKTCHQLDPYNGQISDLINQVEDIKKRVANNAQVTEQLQQMEAEAREHPTNVQNLVGLGNIYMQMGQTNEASGLFNQALTNSALTYAEVATIAQLYSRMGAGYFNQLEVALQKLARLAPESVQPEAYYDLAALKVMTGKTSEALDDLRISMDLNAKRLKADPTAHNLAVTNRSDARFDALRNLPEYQKIVSPK